MRALIRKFIVWALSDPTGPGIGVVNTNMMLPSGKACHEDAPTVKITGAASSSMKNPHFNVGMQHASGFNPWMLDAASNAFGTAPARRDL